MKRNLPNYYFIIMTITMIMNLFLLQSCTVRRKTCLTNSKNVFFASLIGGSIIAIGATVISYFFCWSDLDIIAWAEQKITAIENSYNTISNRNYTIIESMRLFGTKNSLNAFVFSDLETIITENSNFFPLHHAELIIKNDIRTLKSVHYHLTTRNLTTHQSIAHKYKKLTTLLNALNELIDKIIVSDEYARESQQLDKKIDRLHKNKLMEQQANNTRSKEIEKVRFTI